MACQTRIQQLPVHNGQLGLLPLQQPRALCSCTSTDDTAKMNARRLAGVSVRTACKKRWSMVESAKRSTLSLNVQGLGDDASATILFANPYDRWSTTSSRLVIDFIMILIN